MKTIPSPETILQLLDRLDEVVADDLETEVLDFKRWRGAKESLAEAVETAVCFANADGGIIVFGVKDRGRPLTSLSCFFFPFCGNMEKWT